MPPDMAKYSRVGQEVRELMLATTPVVEPLSIDEAFLDLTGTETAPSRLARRRRWPRWPGESRSEIGVTVSIGLSYNKFLAKIASDLDKPRGFSVIGQARRRNVPGGAGR